ncbi:helix-turn-helix domain-containing protein [Paenibacillus sp. YIM B09110]|uniref:helix-turn-helix domain-containing protein n=1 Tax=Paenibacillus sp. YIM B09110 TaxID=3126102 RepID=UPI00301D2343
MDSIGERLKSIRKMQDMNQQQFSSRVGISQGRLSELEIGKTFPSTDTLISIAEIFKLDLNWLIHESSNSKTNTNIYSEIESLLSMQSEEIQSEVLSFIKFKLKENNKYL